jgi:proline utilization trans-activator
MVSGSIHPLSFPHPPTGFRLDMTVTPQTQKKRKRVPDALRRRAAVSCDRCKLRRVKCIRAAGQDACNSCLSSHVKCESTLPRKQRVYGSLESLSLRYRALDALVKGLFPDEDTQDIASLYRIAAQRGISMPPGDSQSPVLEIFSQDPPQQVELPLRAAPVEHDASHDVPAGAIIGKHLDIIAEEKLIPTPNGSALYVGPSSSFLFATIVRAMVARCGACRLCRQPRRPNKAERADFIGLRASKALEIRTPDHDSGAGEDESSLPDPSESSHPKHQGLKRRDSRFEGPLTIQEITSPARNYTIEHFLPSRSIADTFVRAFFDKVHSDYAIFHRSMFQLRYEALWERKASPLKDVDPGWICCLSMVFVFGAQALEEHSNESSHQIQTRFLALARSATGRLISTSSLLNVQAIMLILLYEHNSGERNAAWMLIGCATRMAMALGMHREGTTAGFDPIERNTRKRVWWTLYLLERHLCLILGRPSGIDDMEVTTCLPDESMFDTMETPPGYMHHLVRLSRLSYKAKKQLFNPTGSTPEDEQRTIAKSKELAQELELWRTQLPPPLEPDYTSMAAKQRRAVLLLQIYYHYLRALIARPFLITRVRMEIGQLEREDMSPPPITRDIQFFNEVCVDSSEKTMEYIHQLIDNGLFNGVGWLDAYYIYHAMFVLCLDLLVRPVDAVDTAEEMARKEIVKSMVTTILRTKLAPTYRTLFQVANQFAGLSGALDDPRDVRAEDAVQPVITQATHNQMLAAHLHLPDNRSHEIPQAHMTDYLQPPPPIVDWDFFDMGNLMPTMGNHVEVSYPYQGETFVPAPIAGTFESAMPREGEVLAAMGEMDDWAARALRDITRGAP